MNTQQFKADYYIERNYQSISEVEFYCKLIVKNKTNDQEITGIETKINVTEIRQDIADSQFSANPITFENFLNQTIKLLFNMLMIRLNIDDLYNTGGQDKIAEFFDQDPFHKE